MKLRIVLFAAALGAGPLMTAPGSALAHTGFETTPCSLTGPVPGSGVVHSVVPGSPTAIQDAVDAAVPGDAIVIAAGTYHEAVHVTTPNLLIHGADRNGVQLDGASTLAQPGKHIGIQIDADDVVVENLTVHHYVEHGIRWGGNLDSGPESSVNGYWSRYITAYDNGDYGIFAKNSRCGQWDHDFASGNADSGFYIGQCFPCDAVITNIESTGNALGYSGTNAGGNLTLRDSNWHENGLGIVPNSLNGEERPPQRGITIEHNLVTDNNQADAPGAGIAGEYFGSGIVIAGGSSNVIIGNDVTDHIQAGIALSPLPDPTTDKPTQSPGYIPSGNTIWGNTVHGSGTADLIQGALSGPNNCWSDNEFETSSPPAVLETVWDCALPLTPPGGDPRVELSIVLGVAGLNGRVQSPWQTWPVPGPQPSMPAGLALTPWLPALGS